MCMHNHFWKKSILTYKCVSVWRTLCISRCLVESVWITSAECSLTRNGDGTVTVTSSWQYFSPVEQTPDTPSPYKLVVCVNCCLLCGRLFTSRASAAALSSVKDDHAFIWKHAIFRHLPSRNPTTDQNEISHDWLSWQGYAMYQKW
jgi:hypothetical protein